jgi:uncharacterized protein YigE (DUF2233 family)
MFSPTAIAGHLSAARGFSLSSAPKTMLQLSLVFVFGLTSRGHGTPEKRIVDGVTYHVLRASASSVRILWKDSKGIPLRTFPATMEYLNKSKTGVDTLMNGGIFEPGGVPSGLLVQDGKELRPVNRNDGNGNFFLKPNGVFLIGSAGAAVIRSDEYPLQGSKTTQAVQSGPLLLRYGKTHPLFNPGSGSRLHRNGVGVSKNGEVVFAMTDIDSPKFPNLHEFAELFRVLECENALFLDGDISQMRSGADLSKPSNNFGAIIAVIEPDGKAGK